MKGTEQQIVTDGGVSAETEGMQFIQKSDKDVWQTPEEIIEPIQQFTGIDLDPCAGRDTDHAEVNFRPWIVDGLEASWNVREDVTAFVNPPFSEKKRFLQKGIGEYLVGNVDRVFFLTPDSTDTISWWHAYIATYCEYTWFPEGRINYVDPETGKQVTGVSFGSALSVVGDLPDEFMEWMDDRGDLVHRPLVGGSRE